MGHSATSTRRGRPLIWPVIDQMRRHAERIDPAQHRAEQQGVMTGEAAGNASSSTVILARMVRRACGSKEALPLTEGPLAQEPPIGIEPMTYALRVRRSDRLS
jgi:hypothetical protein